MNFLCWLSHDWSNWEIGNAEFERGLLYGKHAGKTFEGPIQWRRCKQCGKLDWRRL